MMPNAKTMNMSMIVVTGLFTAVFESPIYFTVISYFDSNILISESASR
jgi:hypothetical protein